MLNKLQDMFGRTEGHEPRGGNWRDALPAAETTQPPSGLLKSMADKVRPLPLDVAAKAAARAHDRMVHASGEWIQAERALEKLKAENAEREALQQALVAKKLEDVQTAETDYDRAQARLLVEARDAGAINGKYVDFQSMTDGKDDDQVPTVRVDVE